MHTNKYGGVSIPLMSYVFSLEYTFFHLSSFNVVINFMYQNFHLHHGSVFVKYIQKKVDVVLSRGVGDARKTANSM